jgi:hypothetical protein
MTLGRERRRGGHRRIMLLAAALVLLALVFVGGYAVGNSGNGLSGAGHTLKLVGTGVAPRAEASLVIQEADNAGNWPMKLTEAGLPRLPGHSYYEVYVTRNGKPWASCGVFTVRSPTSAVSVQLNAPYSLRGNVSWVVTKQIHGERGVGPIVLQPA